MTRVTASFDTLMNQAKLTGDDYFRAARRILTESELAFSASDVIALARVMAEDYHDSATLIASQNIADAIDNLASRIPEV